MAEVQRDGKIPAIIGGRLKTLGLKELAEGCDSCSERCVAEALPQPSTKEINNNYRSLMGADGLWACRKRIESENEDAKSLNINVFFTLMILQNRRDMPNGLTPEAAMLPLKAWTRRKSPKDALRLNNLEVSSRDKWYITKRLNDGDEVSKMVDGMAAKSAMLGALL